MIATIPFDPNRFQSAARHYFARASYPQRLIEKVVAEVGLTPDDRVIDLGCGPGVLALALAPFAGRITGIDPSTEMLAVAREAAATAPFGDRLAFVEGSSNDLGPEAGTCRLVTMGRSFHWMDRADTLRRLDRIVLPGGAIALFEIETVRRGPDDWQREFHAILERYEAGKSVWRTPDWVRHQAVLVESAFSMVEGVSVIERHRFPAAQLVDRAFSMSRTAPAAIGREKATALAAEVMAFASRIAIDGEVEEILQANALIARRL